MTTLFSPSTFSKQSDTVRSPRCGACGLSTKCKSPRMPVTGEGDRRILIVAEAPGENEDLQGVQLIGRAGQKLRKVLRSMRIDLDRDCWKTNAVICRSVGTPTKEQILACRPNLLKTIRELKPETIILMGGVAVSSLIGWLWKEEVGEVSRWVGWKIPCQKLNSWLCPTFHPAYVARTETDKRLGPVVDIWFREHLKEALKLKGRPWKDLPEYVKSVRVVWKAEDVPRIVRDLVRDDLPTAFDFETNMLKPDGMKADIVTCALSNGGRTIAYPMHGPAIPATREFLRSPLPKIASNLKFEDRWCRAILKTAVRNWWHDTMLCAHVLDNRRGITGLKFQAFVLLGQESYDESVSPYLKSPDSNVPNQIRKADMGEVLRYNGMDALLTVEVAKRQRRKM